jgi:hypothetical protein
MTQVLQSLELFFIMHNQDIVVSIPGLKLHWLSLLETNSLKTLYSGQAVQHFSYFLVIKITTAALETLTEFTTLYGGCCLSQSHDHDNLLQ